MSITFQNWVKSKRLAVRFVQVGKFSSIHAAVDKVVELCLYASLWLRDDSSRLFLDTQLRYS